MANLIGAGMVSGSTPPPIEYYVQDNFENGLVDPAWTFVGSTVQVDTWANFGISGPSGGGNYGCLIPVDKIMSIDIPETDTIWATCWAKTAAIGASPVYLMRTYHNTGALQRMRIYPQSTLQIENTANGVVYLSDRVFDLDTWYKFKFHILIHDTTGILQAWYDDGSGWVITIDEQNIDTARPVGLINLVYCMASAARSPNYYDEYNILKADPGVGMRSN